MDSKLSIVRTITGETLSGFAVEGYKWKHESGTYSYASHWSTGPKDAVRLFSETDMCTALSRIAELEAANAELTKKLENVREEFFGLIADANRWDEDVDGDETGITITYFAEFRHNNLTDLLDAFGFKQAFGETAGDRLKRVMEETGS